MPGTFTSHGCPASQRLLPLFPLNITQLLHLSCAVIKPASLLCVLWVYANHTRSINHGILKCNRLCKECLEDLPTSILSPHFTFYCFSVSIHKHDFIVFRIESSISLHSLLRLHPPCKSLRLKVPRLGYIYMISVLIWKFLNIQSYL